MKVITIAQQKGGAGKTTIAAHLATAFSQRGKRTAIIDIDPQASLGTWHRFREEKFGEDYTGLTCITSNGFKLKSEIAALEGEVDVIIVDSPPHIEAEAAIDYYNRPPTDDPHVSDDGSRVRKRAVGAAPAWASSACCTSTLWPVLLYQNGMPNASACGISTGDR